MGTFEASRIRTASQEYVCGDHLPGRGCGDVIKRGDRYLSFAPGHRGRIPICLTTGFGRKGCAYDTTPSTCTGLKYHCRAMLAELAQENESEAGK